MVKATGSYRELTDVDCLVYCGLFGFAVSPAWAGNDIIFRSAASEPGKVSLYKMPAAGGERRMLSTLNAWSPKVSPDGSRILHRAYYPDEDRNKVDVIVLATEEVEHSFYIRGAQEVAWSPDGTAIHYSKHTDGQDSIWSQPLDGGDPRQITNFTELDIFELCWSPDGKTLALSRGKIYRDIVLLKNFR